MPRIYTSDNSPLDFCIKCFPRERKALRDFSNMGDGPDGRGNCFEYDADHPPYEYENYTCIQCERLLDSTDNGW